MIQLAAAKTRTQAPSPADVESDSRTDAPTETASSPGADAATAPDASAPRLRLFFFPDRTEDGAYRTGLYSGFDAAADVAPGSIDDAIEAACAGGERVVFHLHRREAVFGDAAGAERRCARAEMFLRKISIFQDCGGVFAWTIHDRTSRDPSSRVHDSWLNERLTAAADLIHVHSAEAVGAVGELPALPRHKCVVAPYGSYVGFYPSGISRAAARSRLGLDQDGVVFSFVGGLHPGKDLDLLIAAYRKLRSSRKDVQIVLAGEPARPAARGSFKDLEKFVPGLAVSEGAVDDVELQAYFAAADFIALPYEDALGSGAAELAASFGKPIIRPRPATPGSAGVERFALAYEPGSIDSLRDCLERAYGLSESDRQALSVEASRHAAGLTFAQTSETFLRAVRSVAHPSVALATVGGRRHRIVRTAPDDPMAGGVGVAIVSRGAAAQAVDLANSLPRDAGGRPLRIYVYDRSDDDREIDALRRGIAEGAVILRGEQNASSAAGANVLLRLMRDEGCAYGLVLAPDIRIARQALEELLRCSDAHPDAVVSPVLLKANGEISFAGAHLGDAKEIGVHPLFEGASQERLPSRPYAVDTLSGRAFLTPLRLLDAVGSMTEERFLHHAETHWFLRIRKAGAECMVAPEARLTQLETSRRSVTPGLYETYHGVRNALALNRRRGKEATAAEARLRRAAAAGWRRRLLAEHPSALRMVERAFEAGVEDGLREVTGEVELGRRLDQVKLADGTTVSGLVERVEAERIVGWASRKARDDDPAGDRPVKLWLLADGVAVGEVEATIVRPDVKAAGHAELSGFAFPIPTWLRTGRKMRLEVRSADDGLRLPVNIKMPQAPGARLSLDKRSLEARFLPANVDGKEPDYRARLEGVSKGVLRGWAADLAAPGRAVLLDVEVNGERVSGVTADVSRPDLRAAGYGEGRHGFEIALPVRHLDKPCAAVLYPSGEDRAIAFHTLENNATSYGYRTSFEPAEYLAWAFLEDRMPAGAYEASDRLKTYFDVNKSVQRQRADMRETGPLVSVIMPAFNRAALLGRSVRSALAQSYRNWELIIVDDGSSDETFARACELRDSDACGRIRVLKHDRNLGVSAARNAGIKAARGDIIAYLDSDNLWDAGFLSIVAMELTDRPETLCVYAGQEIWERIAHFDVCERRLVRASPFNRSRLEQRNYIDLNVFAHRREAVETYGPFRDDMRRLVDWELILRYTEDAPPAFIPALLSQYYMKLARNQITFTEEFAGDRRKVRAVAERGARPHG